MGYWYSSLCNNVPRLSIFLVKCQKIKSVYCKTSKILCSMLKWDNISSPIVVLILKSWRITNKGGTIWSVELLFTSQITYQALIFLNPVQSWNIFTGLDNRWQFPNQILNIQTHATHQRTFLNPIFF